MKIEELSNGEIYGLIRTATAELENREQRRAKPATSSVEDTQGLVKHEGLVLRKVDHKVSAGVYVRFHNTKFQSRLKDGVIYGPVKRTMTIGDHDYNVFNEHHNRTPKTVEVFEVVGAVDDVKKQLGILSPSECFKPKTTNQQRAQTIQRAREFVEDALKSSNEEGLVINHDYYKNPTISFFRKGNKTTCVITPENTMLERFVGRSLCSVGDVFNEWIGKAIALAKTLEIDIPQEFIDAVQPTEFAVGQIVNWGEFAKKQHEITEIDDDKARYINKADGERDFHWLYRVNDGTCTIIDDTNAQYGHSNEA